MNKQLRSMTLAVSALLAAALLCGCNDVSTELKPPTFRTGLKDGELKMSAFKTEFPAQYASYMKNNETEVMTEYKGSVEFRKNDNVNPLPRGYKHAQPYLKNLWLGYPFMYEYNEARGHTYALQDLVKIDRINRYAEKGVLPATCWNCKTPKMEQWEKEMGDRVWSQESISCATCHDAKTMALRLYSTPLKDWLARTGQDWDKLSRNEKRSLVCAQCHVEYYFTHKDNGPAAKPVFPWDRGMNPEDMYQYYTGYGARGADGKPGQYVDWVHAASKVPMIKMQHPEYETWIDGPHGAAGVSCADCHMQYQRVDGKKMSSHWITSPLKDRELRACRQCHADKSPEFLRERVLYTQKKTFDQLLKAQELSVKAHEAVRLANAWEGARSPDYDALMAEARQMVRKGQLFWDYVSAENSVGFHNPAKALDTLMSSSEYSQKAVDLAEQATNYGIAPALAGDITKIVPPILELSRKLQQDADFLQKNPWTKLLPVLPKADQVWDGQERLTSAR